jgi:spermidine dehydrogenase
MASEKDDKRLGLHQPISRRQFVQGSAVALGASIVPWAHAEDFNGSPELSKTYYPPAKTGLRGMHIGSFETAHALAHNGKRWNSAMDTVEGVFDLVVVGGGISGLSAAYFYQQKHPDARILILDNHDDFGGHAKRNEFSIDGETIIGYGGSQSIDTPSSYSPEALALLAGIGIDLDVFYQAFDQDLYKNLGLQSSFWLNKETFGIDRLVKGNPLYYGAGDWSEEANEKFASEMTHTEADKKDMLKWLASEEDFLEGKTSAEKISYLRSLNYDDYLRQHVGIGEYVIKVVNPSTKGYWGYGTDALSAREAMWLGMPGFAGLGVELERDDPYIKPEREDPYIFHFPDGNAGVARLLVRKMIPAVNDGSTMEDVVEAKFDYGVLDQPDNPVKIRLSSTVVHVEHNGELNTAENVTIRYVKNDVAHQVRGKHVVWAGFSAMIPYCCPEFPKQQAEAFAKLVKIPLLYANVLIRDWQSFAKLGINSISFPGGLFSGASLDFPISLGGYEFSQSPDEPIVVHMTYVPTTPGQGLDGRTQSRLGRHEMLRLSFEDYERAIRSQLGDALAAGGFDPATDIIGITVNRWPHGYAYEYNDLYDPPDWNRYKGPHIEARKPFGRITIANSDAEAFAYVNGAIDSAYRSINEIDNA